MGKLSPEALVPGDGVAELVESQLELLESQLERQEAAMAARGSAASTRSAVLIGASALLAGAELATTSLGGWITAAALTLYLVAAVLGLISARSRFGREPALPAIVAEYANFATISMRRELLLARLRSHVFAVGNLADRHRLLVWGFWALGVAWVLAATGSVLSSMEPTPVSVTDIRILK